MPKIEYPEGPLEREYLRDAMRRQGKDNVDDLAAAIQRRWHHSPLRSYRLATELSLEEVCKQVNKLLGVFAEESGYLHHPTLSRFEYWPATPKSRRPTVSHLAALAQVYRTTPRRLIDAADWGKLPPAERFALAALDSQAETGATKPAATVGMMETARPPAGRTPLVPPTPWDGSERTRSGNPTERDVLMSGEESTRFAGHGGNIDDLTLDQLREETQLRAATVRNSPLAVDTRDQIEDFLSTAPIGLQLS